MLQSVMAPAGIRLHGPEMVVLAMPGPLPKSKPFLTSFAEPSGDSTTCKYKYFGPWPKVLNRWLLNLFVIYILDILLYIH